VPTTILPFACAPAGRVQIDAARPVAAAPATTLRRFGWMILLVTSVSPADER
jgi:hypothetical protein